MWHHDVTNARTCQFSAVCLTVFPFEVRPRTFTIGFYGKKNSILSELMILECSFPLINKLISMGRGAIFQHFCIWKVITTARAPASCHFLYFSRALKQQQQQQQQQQNKALRPKMAKRASMGPALRQAWTDHTFYFRGCFFPV